MAFKYSTCNGDFRGSNPCTGLGIFIILVTDGYVMSQDDSMGKVEFIRTLAFSGASVGSMVGGALFLLATWTWKSTPYVGEMAKNLLVDSMGVLFVVSGLLLMAFTFKESLYEDEE